MKIVMKDIEVIVHFNKNEFPRPLRMRLEDAEFGKVVIPIKTIIHSEMEKYAGNRMILYRCKSVINNMEKLFELKYELDTYKWYLYKM